MRETSLSAGEAAGIDRDNEAGEEDAGVDAALLCTDDGLWE